MKNIIFIAPPASGKGTFSKILQERLGYKHLAIGDCLRQEVENGNEELKSLIENGQLVSDEIIISIINSKISELKGTPFIIDGCPRTLNQTILLNEVFEKEKITDVAVIKLDIDIEIAKKRILGRRNCKCGKTYNVNNENLKPKIDEICDVCGSYLYQRSDDTEEKIVIRFSEYEKNIEPIVEFYKNKNILFEINADDSVENIFEYMKGIIND